MLVCRGANPSAANFVPYLTLNAAIGTAKTQGTPRKDKDRQFNRTKAATMATIPPEEGCEQVHRAVRRGEHRRHEG